MILVLKKDASKAEIEEIEKKLFNKKPRTGFNAKKYNGKINLKSDPMEIQKTMRDEWERNFS